MSLTIRPMSVDDLRLALIWARAEGWNPGIDDAEAFRAADPGGFLIGRNEDGEPVVAISAVSYDAGYGFLGLYICRPEFRGRGHGMTLWRAAMERFGPRVVGLDGVVAQIDNYRSSGFVVDHRNRRFSAALHVPPPSDARVHPVDAALLPAVLAFDRRHVPTAREPFLRAWIGGAPSRSALALVEDGTITGYGVIRACGEGHKIGPLFAETADGADVLFRSLCTLRAGRGPVFLDVPDPNGAGTALAERYGMTPAFETLRMYRGPAPELPLDRIYGVTTFELG